ncbi:hypothetical protein ER308_13890 [Egibacter rhizosphaerae]|uniref:Uncharacterized protein n=1 Tax=Egibacter rhizosphaerae TaxID=1670831 RepID=A0A411YLH2_9ACTN|nr:hypothetical protein ER308_13890 [Egibacter rhizosphaerae]
MPWVCAGCRTLIGAPPGEVTRELGLSL